MLVLKAVLRLEDSSLVLVMRCANEQARERLCLRICAGYRMDRGARRGVDG
jgi:hypothetical protein